MNLIMAPQRPIDTERDRRWQAVVQRDASADGRFVYAVLTTGVYCRPSCPSRRAKPENVSFHDSPQDAEAAGYRPCKRCAPNAASADTPVTALVERVCRIIEQADEPLGLLELAERVGLSLPTCTIASSRHRHHASSLCQGAPGTPGTRSVERSGHGHHPGHPCAGFRSSGRFYENADAMLGMTPTTYQRGGPDTVIRFAVGECSLGAVLVACSPRGICAILLGDDPDSLARDLQDRFPQAKLCAGADDFEDWVARVIG